ncbi:MAG TPA: hypothetical protein PLN93_02785 [Vicinamibacterales bacterium]|nr:hypothetical protein [Vicinamibacterales bacterium]HOQ60342.1 hypothetical protein [Vicinamibacterales bacterium]HPK70843.1 hypothetical protein [Vicinamibacterales bacterium]
MRQVLEQAWRQFAAQSLSMLPNVLASLLFLVIGVALAVAAGRVARFLLRRSAVERRASRLGVTSWLERAGILSATAALVRLVQIVFALMTAALVLYALDAELAADLTRRFFLYLPDLAVGIGIFVVGLLAARVAGRSVLIGAVNHGIGAARLLATGTRGAVIVLTGAMALDQLGIGKSIVPSALIILLGGVTLAAALAVGFGSRDTVGRWLDDRLRRPAPADADDIQHW